MVDRRGFLASLGLGALAVSRSRRAARKRAFPDKKIQTKGTISMQGIHVFGIGDEVALSDPAVSNTWICGVVSGWKVHYPAGGLTQTEVYVENVHRVYAWRRRWAPRGKILDLGLLTDVTYSTSTMSFYG